MVEMKKKKNFLSGERNFRDQELNREEDNGFSKNGMENN